ncbi:LysR family transcriptional regulator [Lacticaseibacillus zhaodongensis]|uniref:LysR family transcriptional regulator n=1 Tax=Lacticaseibacillus zhaodongensis TaxID=2668065 RepID=UPI0012D33205|nr:LysR family transcriptional regulator [Lacticaseibacillus zhaodongensis]
MNLTQLQGFVYAAQTGSITQAARQAYVSQPAMSKMIKELEKELGVPLFDRVGRGIVINDAGRVFLNYVETGLDQIQAGVEAVAKRTTKQQPIRLLVEVASALIPGIITTIHHIYPDAPIKLTQRIAAVNDTHDFDFTISTRQPRRDRRSVPLLNEEIMVGSADPQIKEQQFIKPEELVGLPVVALGGHTPLRSTLDAYFDSLGIQLNYQYESDDPATIRAMLGAGVGIGFIPSVTWADTGKQLHLARIAPNPPYRTIYLTEGQAKEDARTREVANALVALFVSEREHALTV